MSHIPSSVMPHARVQPDPEPAMVERPSRAIGVGPVLAFAAGSLLVGGALAAIIPALSRPPKA